MGKIIETIKTVLFIGLFVSAVAMAGIYIAAQPRDEDAGNLPDEVLLALRGGTGSRAVSPVEGQLLPEFLGIKESGKKAVGLAHNAAMLGDLGEAMNPWVAFVLGDGARVETLDETAGKADWRRAMTSDTYFYLRWRFAVPASLLRAHSLPERADAMLGLAGENLPRIAEIFFFPDGWGDGVCALSRDSEGRVSRWYRTPGAEDALPEMDDFGIYLERGVLAPYVFAGSEEPGGPAGLDMLPVFGDVLTLPQLTASLPYAAVAARARVSEGVLTLFGYNPNKVSSYYEADTDTAVYVGTQGTLRASATSLAYEATAQGGLAVADLVRRSGSVLNLRDDILACEALAEALRQADAAVAGGDATLVMTAISTSDGALRVAYGYTYNNVAIVADTPAMVVTVRDHRIVAVEVTVATYRASETLARAADQRWMRNLAAHMVREQGEAAEGCTIRLCYTASIGDAATLRADWVLYPALAAENRR